MSAKGISTYHISVTGDKAPNAAPETAYIGAIDFLKFP